MLNFFFVALAGLSGLFSPRLEMNSSSEVIFGNTSLSWNVATAPASKWSVNSTSTNKQSSDWKYGWSESGFGLKHKNASIETNSSVTSNSSKWNEGWGVFAKRHGMKLHKHLKNLRGKFRSVKNSFVNLGGTPSNETRSSLSENDSIAHSLHKCTTYGNTTTNASEYRNKSIRNDTKGRQKTRNDEAQTAAVHEVEDAKRSAKLVDDKIIEISKKEKRELAEKLQNTTEAARFANREAERLESEADRVGLEVRRLEKELKILVRDSEERRDMQDKLTVKAAEFERIQTEARHKRTEADNLDFQLKRKDAELKSLQKRVKKYELLINETRDSYEKSRIIEATKKAAHELAGKISHVTRVAEDVKGKSEQQRSLESNKEDKGRKDANDEQVMPTKKFKRLNNNVQRKTEKLGKINSRIKLFEDIEKAVMASQSQNNRH